MLIRSQDRTKLVDIAGKTISIKRINSHMNSIEILYANSSVALGSYFEERASKVLDLIGQAYNNFETGFRCDVFQMPQDEEVDNKYKEYEKYLEDINEE